MIIVTGLVLAAAGIYVGWELPHREECSGDTCRTTLAIDWSRVDWGIPPQRLACGVAHPDEGDVLVGPGEVCVTSSGTGSTEVTYEELRSRATQRRVLSLIVVAVILATATTAALVVVRRRPRESSPQASVG
ncbi:MAG TPA: hypothetical protein VK028_03085 [Micromonosporaceae bacterium]|nr:hypothetical protein [Micromonosporaceae bacterium]